jgi:hypothetical protein
LFGLEVYYTSPSRTTARSSCIRTIRTSFAQKHLRERDQQIHYTKKDWDFFTLDRAPGEGGPGQAQVFYQQDYLRRHWANYLKVVSITPESYWYQSAVLLQNT